MNLELTDKIGIITGASQGIGLAITKYLFAQGMKLIIVARSKEKLDEISNNLDKSRVISYCCDLTESGIHQKVVNYSIEKFGRIDLLVNNAGSTERGDFLSLTDDQWQKGFDLKFYSTVKCIQSAWPFLVQSKGSVVNIIGIGGRVGSWDFTIGGSVNSALINVTKALAGEGLKKGIKINAINPGYIKTERLERRVNDYAINKSITFSEAYNILLNEYGITRFGDPEEIASVVGFLASKLSSYCQGCIIDVDGGRNNAV